MNSFMVIDVETANSWIASICQIGIVECRDGEIVTAMDQLIVLVQTRSDIDT